MNPKLMALEKLLEVLAGTPSPEMTKNPEVAEVEVEAEEEVPEEIA